MNLRLFFLALFLKTVFIVISFLLLGMLFFLYFGSGAGASSKKAIWIGKMVLLLLIIVPLVFGIFKYVTLKDKSKGRSYLFAGLLVTTVSGFLSVSYIY